MSLQNISVLGFSSNDAQFVVKSKELSIKINNQIVSDESADGNGPLEFLLAGIAGAINAVGKIIAREQNFDLQSIQVEITGVIESKKSDGIKTRSRAGFKSIDVIIKPSTNASLTEIKYWMDEVKARCPIYDNLTNATPVVMTVVKDYNVSKVA
ncbi:OsmC family protein [Flavobacterium sp. I3-2]|uniref:OsmC family protein n=1 Tax=Flavobacterium sp. I3-2 TaxID=2748319 RepID=UPI0015ACBDE7|nr:OsmC family protein [Flavobacterium sp. I3-2]